AKAASIAFDNAQKADGAEAIGFWNQAIQAAEEQETIQDIEIESLKKDPTITKEELKDAENIKAGIASNIFKMKFNKAVAATDFFESDKSDDSNAEKVIKSWEGVIEAAKPGSIVYERYIEPLKQHLASIPEGAQKIHNMMIKSEKMKKQLLEKKESNAIEHFLQDESPENSETLTKWEEVLKNINIIEEASNKIKNANHILQNIFADAQPEIDWIVAKELNINSEKIKEELFKKNKAIAEVMEQYDCIYKVIDEKMKDSFSKSDALAYIKYNEIYYNWYKNEVISPEEELQDLCSIIRKNLEYNKKEREAIASTDILPEGFTREDLNSKLPIRDLLIDWTTISRRVNRLKEFNKKLKETSETVKKGQEEGSDFHRFWNEKCAETTAVENTLSPLDRYTTDRESRNNNISEEAKAQLYADLIAMSDTVIKDSPNNIEILKRASTEAVKRNFFNKYPFLKDIFDHPFLKRLTDAGFLELQKQGVVQTILAKEELKEYKRQCQQRIELNKKKILKPEVIKDITSEVIRDIKIPPLRPIQEDHTPLFKRLNDSGHSVPNNSLLEELGRSSQAIPKNK
ncbi:MAG: hypothetical protein ACH349_07420, partial [Candidatus Rhabdochlamydia sp.]